MTGRTSDHDCRAVIFNDSIRNCQAQPRSHADVLGGKERINDAHKVFRINTDAQNIRRAPVTRESTFVAKRVILPPRGVASIALIIRFMKTCSSSVTSPKIAGRFGADFSGKRYASFLGLFTDKQHDAMQQLINVQRQLVCQKICARQRAAY